MIDNRHTHRYPYKQTFRGAHPQWRTGNLRWEIANFRPPARTNGRDSTDSVRPLREGPQPVSRGCPYYNDAIRTTRLDNEDDEQGTHNDDDATTWLSRRRNPKREGEQRADQVPAWLALLLERTHFCTDTGPSPPHEPTEGSSCGPQVDVVRTSVGRPCTDIVQRDTYEPGKGHTR